MRIPILSFTKFKKLNSIHLCIDNMIALSYLLNMGGTQNSEQTFNQNLKRNVIAEYRPSLSNQTGDWESRNFQAADEKCFQTII